MIARLLCFILGHDFVEVQKFENTSRVVCPRCRSDWGMHHGLRVMVPWTPEIEKVTRIVNNGVLIHNPWGEE